MRKQIIIFFIAASLSLISFNSFSQCAMCQLSAETGHSNNHSTAGGLNKGILYLLAIPYVLGGIGVVAWYKNRKR